MATKKAKSKKAPAPKSKSQARRLKVQAKAKTAGTNTFDESVAKLLEAGFTETPQIHHTGAGDAKVFEKIVDGVRTYKRVHPDGSVEDHA